jgi:hypothetical protein
MQQGKLTVMAFILADTFVQAMSSWFGCGIVTAKARR